MIIREEWKGFDVTPAGYNLDNEGKSVVCQSFVNNLKSRINQVSASGNSLLLMPPPPSLPPPILPFLIADPRTAGQSFGCQGTRQRCAYDSLSPVSINVRPYNDPVHEEKVNCLT